ncbi:MULTISPECIES: TetR/AcrR family transcriptional regulator [unclassified Pseudofrankia]|uniref:TetR/AcrR family transcriptional regulator n=1 Tax=unclassified Pseudofrankia TaxID=2994372 RepID=UPI0008DB101C|nr:MULTISPECIES: TetR/AcrR family transcriptional regulator [unclassified Pseudofrankia]MDT3440609.1 TetR/AcrR family transcriptional regulator [Pseudofrankia sp. BMG5.37]OHV62170.1 TetR family transcriptional regulator [Pseudofrankia sp. BMG5.36]
MEPLPQPSPATASPSISGADSRLRAQRWDDDGPRSRRGAETRARLVEAAKAVFEEKGFHEARISDVAERAGLTHSAFYHYFDSKEDILREVAAVLDHTLNAGVDIILDPTSTATPHERLASAMRTRLEAHRKEARIMGVIEQVARHNEQIRALWTQFYKQHVKEMANSIAQLQRRGLADPALDPVIVTDALAVMTIRFAEQSLLQDDSGYDFDTAVEQITRIYINALQLREPKKPRRRRDDTG